MALPEEYADNEYVKLTTPHSGEAYLVVVGDRVTVVRVPAEVATDENE